VARLDGSTHMHEREAQDLLRLARSSNAGASLLHSIEGMAEGSYANTNEVLRALGMAH
jgi:hypothetical protein